MTCGKDGKVLIIPDIVRILGHQFPVRARCRARPIYRCNIIMTSLECVITARSGADGKQAYSWP